MPKRDLPRKSIWDEPTALSYLSQQHAIKVWHYLIHDPASKGILEENVEAIPFDRWRISKEASGALIRDVGMSTTKVVERLDSARGDSTKLLIELQDGHRIETVVMKHAKHATVCVSSQIGCKMGCRFCATGTMGIIGDLSSGEIIEQLMHANQVSKIRNVVFMGMGEPLANYENVKSAVAFMVDERRFGLSPRQVTVSTVGVLKNMRRLSDELPLVNLALSLHAPSQSVRIKIVPSAGAHHIDKLLEAVDYHIARPSRAPGENSGSRRRRLLNESSVKDEPTGSGPGEYNLSRKRLHQSGVMIEYILISNVNDLEEHAHQLGKLLRPRREYVLLNLIPYNPTSVAEDYEPPTDEAVERFFQICTSDEYKLHTRVRGEKGQDIEGACGQLALVKPGNKSRAASVDVDIEDYGSRIFRPSLPCGTTALKAAPSQISRIGLLWAMCLPGLAVALSIFRR